MADCVHFRIMPDVGESHLFTLGFHIGERVGMIIRDVLMERSSRIDKEL
jgi:hypothetical protein